MKLDRKKLSFRPAKNGTFNLYYDITSMIGLGLPDYIVRAEIYLEGNFESDELEDEYYIQRVLKRLEEDIEEEDFQVSKEEIQANARRVLLTFADGFQIEAWNSEWGGLTMFLPQKDA